VRKIEGKGEKDIAKEGRMEKVGGEDSRCLIDEEEC